MRTLPITASTHLSERMKRLRTAVVDNNRLTTTENLPEESVSRRDVLLVMILMMAPVSWAETKAGTVTLFSQPYCASCEVAKRYLDARAVPYREYNISDSSLAHRYFEKLGGRGTPFFIVNNKRMQGFDSERFWSLYGQPEPEGPVVEAMPLTPPPRSDGVDSRR